MFIAVTNYQAARLINTAIIVTVHVPKELAVNGDFVVRVDVKCGAGNHLAINLYAAINNEFGLAARANACPRNAFGNALVVGCFVKVKTYVVSSVWI